MTKNFRKTVRTGMSPFLLYKHNCLRMYVCLCVYVYASVCVRRGWGFPSGILVGLHHIFDHLVVAY